MHTDFAVITGARHTAAAKPCQDYCVAELLEKERAVAIVSDGCSSGGHTDLGARIWALAALAAVKSRTAIVGADALHDLAMCSAVRLLDRLHVTDGFATLGVLQAYEKRLSATMWGDGALLARHHDGSMTLVNLQHTRNAPPYLNYERTEAMKGAWSREFVDQELMVVTNRYDSEGTLLSLQSIAIASSFKPWQWSANHEDDEIELVMLVTDGVSSRKTGFIDTARSLLAIKSSQGEFLRRRLARQAKDWQTDGSMPGDDLAAAAIWPGRDV